MESGENMKKRIIAAVCIAAVALAGGIVMAASEGKNGGYPYKDATGNIDLAGYFKVEGADLKLEKDNANVVLQGNEATVMFNKPLASDNFQLNFKGVEGSTLKSAEFILTDSENEDECVEIAYTRMSDIQTTVAVNDGNRSFITNGSLYKDNDGVFSVTYSAASNTFGDGAALVIPVPETIDGNGFSGFSSKRVNLTIRLTGEKGSVFSLRAINQQRFGTKYNEDDTAPMISIVNPISYAIKGSTVTLPTAFATDVLAEHASATMSVLDPDGKVVKATDGTKLDNVTPDKEYSMKVEQYGTYRIEFAATDGTNKTRSVVSRLTVSDNRAPELKLEKAVPTSHKVGDKLTFPNVTCTDSASKEENIKFNIVVKHPSGIITSESKTMELTEVGVYEITFMAVDEGGNVARKTVKTYAEEK